MEADAVVYDAVISAGYDFQRAADIIAHRGLRLTTDEVRIYFTRLTDIIEQERGLGAAADIGANADDTNDGDLDLSSFLEDDESSSAPVSPAKEPATVIVESLESLIELEKARLHKIEERQQHRQQIFDRVLESLGGADPSLDNIQAPAPHARYGNSAASGRHTFLEDSKGKHDSNATSDDHSGVSKLMDDVTESLEKQFFDAVGMSEDDVIKSLNPNTTSLQADSSFTLLTTEVMEEDAANNALWDKLLDAALPGDAVEGEGPSELAEVLRFLQSHPPLPKMQPPVFTSATSATATATKPIVANTTTNSAAGPTSITSTAVVPSVAAVEPPVLPTAAEVNATITLPATSNTAPVHSRTDNARMKGRLHASSATGEGAEDESSDEVEVDFRSTRKHLKAAAQKLPGAEDPRAAQKLPVEQTKHTAANTGDSSASHIMMAPAQQAESPDDGEGGPRTDEAINIPPELEVLDYVHAPRIMRRNIPSADSREPVRKSAAPTASIPIGAAVCVLDDRNADNIGFSASAKVISKTWVPMPDSATASDLADC